MKNIFVEFLVFQVARPLTTESPKFWPTFNFQGVFLTTQNSKSQVLVHFSFPVILDNCRIVVIGKMNQKFRKPNLLLHRR